MQIAVLMPAFNEEGRLARTLEELASSVSAAEASSKAGNTSITIFLVDDGSSPPIDERAVHAAVVGEIALIPDIPALIEAVCENIEIRAVDDAVEIGIAEKDLEIIRIPLNSRATQCRHRLT